MCINVCVYIYIYMKVRMGAGKVEEDTGRHSKCT